MDYTFRIKLLNSKNTGNYPPKNINKQLCFFGSVVSEPTILLRPENVVSNMIDEQKMELIEELGVHFERVRQLPPLAARIYSLLILCSKDGYCFESIVGMTKSSKSSVSTNLNLLLQGGIVKYHTKPGDRKRYFRLSKSYLKITLKRYEEMVTEELHLFEKVEAFNKCHNKCKHEKHHAFGLLYKEYLVAAQSNLQHTLKKLNQLELSK